MAWTQSKISLETYWIIYHRWVFFFFFPCCWHPLDLSLILFSCSSLGTSDIFSGRPPLVSPLKLAEAGLVADPDLAFQYGLIDYDEANIDRIRNWEDRRAVILQVSILLWWLVQMTDVNYNQINEEVVGLRGRVEMPYTVLPRQTTSGPLHQMSAVSIPREM